LFGVSLIELVVGGSTGGAATGTAAVITGRG
jgi:hypothetical protein